MSPLPVPVSPFTHYSSYISLPVKVVTYDLKKWLLNEKVVSHESVGIFL